MLFPESGFLGNQEKGVFAKGVSVGPSVTLQEKSNTQGYRAQQYIWHSERHSQTGAHFCKNPLLETFSLLMIFKSSLQDPRLMQQVFWNNRDAGAHDMQGREGFRLMHLCCAVFGLPFQPILLKLKRPFVKYSLKLSQGICFWAASRLCSKRPFALFLPSHQVFTLRGKGRPAPLPPCGYELASGQYSVLGPLNSPNFLHKLAARRYCLARFIPISISLLCCL